MPAPVRFFDPRLARLPGELTEAQVSRTLDLAGATLTPAGAVRLELHPQAGGAPEFQVLADTLETDDGGLLLSLVGGGQLRFTPALAAPVRDTILSLANRTTPYFR